MSLNFAVLDTITDITTYTREHLLASREYLLYMKRTARQAGFGEKSGTFVRDVVGYKFDSMSVDDVLKSMSEDGFLTRYQARADGWHKGLNGSASEGTLKKNASLHSAASALTNDALAWKRLVTALRIVCPQSGMAGEGQRS